MGQFATDDMLAYATSRHQFRPGDRLLFDESYRYAHLPLLAPEHPAAINAPANLDYKSGRYDIERYALVLPVPHSKLVKSHIFQAIENSLRRSSFSHKIAFELCERRRALQHITIAGGFQHNDIPRMEAIVAAYISKTTSLAYQLKGPFIGSKNLGRIYFPCYPSLQHGEDTYAALQNAVGVKQNGFYAMGYYNLIDELNCEETTELQNILDEFANQIIFQDEPDALWITATHDDLVLSGRVLKRLPTGKS